MQQQPNYYANITADVRYCKNLTPNMKLLYGEITALTNKTGECWASNKYFAELYDVTPETVSLWITSLVQNGFVKRRIVYKEGTKQILNRYLEIYGEGIKKNMGRGIKKNLKDNTTSINTTSISREIPQIIKEMESIDPQNKEFYGNKIQRQACEFLIKEYGFDEVKKFIQFISQNTKKIFNPPTTPLKLKKEWVRVVSEVGYKINKDKSKNQEVVYG